VSDDLPTNIRLESQATVKAWYDTRLRLNRVTYEPIKQRQVVDLNVPDEVLRGSDPLAEAKRERPQNWTTRKERPVLAADGKPKFGPDGRMITEQVSIRDTLTANGVATPQRARTKEPRGVSGELEITDASERDQVSPWFYGANATMFRIAMLNNPASHALEMWAAGYSQRRIAQRLGVAKATAATLLELGFSMFDFALFTRPRFRESSGPYVVHALPGDLGLE